MDEQQITAIKALLAAWMVVCGVVSLLAGLFIGWTLWG